MSGECCGPPRPQKKIIWSFRSHDSNLVNSWITDLNQEGWESHANDLYETEEKVETEQKLINWRKDWQNNARLASHGVIVESPEFEKSSFCKRERAFLLNKEKYGKENPTHEFFLLQLKFNSSTDDPQEGCDKIRTWLQQNSTEEIVQAAVGCVLSTDSPVKLEGYSSCCSDYSGTTTGSNISRSSTIKELDSPRKGDCFAIPGW
mmetsp:Transcript_7661/g.14106  ORF Transcript_7661/g.14106 Transcript_7661/m.14106 type:complete len:205 (-) Transcript_7661:46-660(-)